MVWLSFVSKFWGFGFRIMGLLTPNIGRGEGKIPFSLPRLHLLDFEVTREKKV